MMSIKPSQKFGVATPSRAATIPTLSIALYCLVALMIPIGSAMATATRIDQNASYAVFGNAAMIVGKTSRFVL
mgnify:CR=1 FL=1